MLGKILRIDHDLTLPFKRIAICKFKGMGSIIQATPMIQAIRKKFPDAEIIFVSTKANEQFLNKIDCIDTIICINDKGFFDLLFSTFGTIIQLIKKRPGVYIDLEIYSNFSTLVALFSLSKNRIGFYLRESSYRMGIYTHMMFFNPRVPISGVYMQIARLFGEIDETTYLYPIDKNINYNEKIIPKGKYIIINPNASDLRIERRWSANNFASLIQLVLEKYEDLTILLIGSLSERGHTQSVAEQTSSSRVINMAGQTNIDELIGLIKNSSLVITNDTGPMHIAFACKAPTVCLFGPCSPDQYAWTDNAIIIHKNVYCSPCVHDFQIPPCAGDNMCMKLIEVKEVYEAVTSKLEPLAGDLKTSTNITNYNSKNKVFGLVKRP